MSETKALPRPRQVTVAGGMAAVVGVLLVVALFDAMSQVRSVEMKGAIADFLAKPPGDGLGIGVDEVVRLLRVVVLVNGALAAASVVLSVFVLQRHNGARIGLSVTAALLLFTAPVSGGVLPVLLAVAATMLWSRPARDWFAGRPAAPAGTGESEPDESQDRSAPLRAWSPPTPEQRLNDDEAPQQPGPAPYPFGSQPGSQEQPAPPGQSYPYAQPSPYGQPSQQGSPVPPAPSSGYGAPRGYPTPAGPAQRPGTVTAAAWITWVFGGLTVAAYVLVLAVMVAARDVFLEALRNDQKVADMNLSSQDIMAALWVLGVVVIFWSLVAMVLAFLAYRGAGWARITLAVSAGVAGIAALVAFPVGLVHAAAAFTTVALLFSGGANGWYAGRGPAAPYPGATHGPPPSGPPSGPPEQDKPPKNVW